MDQDFSEAAVCIKKKGSDKWLIADIVITDRASEIQNIQFRADI